VPHRAIRDRPTRESVHEGFARRGSRPTRDSVHEDSDDERVGRGTRSLGTRDRVRLSALAVRDIFGITRVSRLARRRAEPCTPTPTHRRPRLVTTVRGSCNIRTLRDARALGFARGELWARRRARGAVGAAGVARGDGRTRRDSRCERSWRRAPVEARRGSGGPPRPGGARHSSRGCLRLASDSDRCFDPSCRGRRRDSLAAHDVPDDLVAGPVPGSSRVAARATVRERDPEVMSAAAVRCSDPRASRAERGYHARVAVWLGWGSGVTDPGAARPGRTAARRHGSVATSRAGVAAHRSLDREAAPSRPGPPGDDDGRSCFT
jgi:hypothetical protein